ncbi:uncharacterized protein LOC127114014 [Lathyrus oleraceus]|uniref:uncharacterized protein LOC127114014 n=1 Tax=Pisum sativum TaxID=3888 RepID=UPI0021CE7199|nr:uncharacterized protein LOC127114014 [Pisum sativum]
MASSLDPVSMVVNSGKSLEIKPKTLTLREEDPKLIIEHIVDFESFRVNGFPLKAYFEDQGWINYFKMLNDPTFPYLINDFWVRTKVHDESAVALKENQKITESEELKGKIRVEMGLEDFKEVEIRSTVMGVNMTITQGHIAKHLNMDNIGRFYLNNKDSSPESYVIKQRLFLKSEDFGKV